MNALTTSLLEITDAQIECSTGTGPVRPGSRAFAIAAAALPGGTLDPTTIPKFTAPLVKPPAMPPVKTGLVPYDYEIAVRQFQQQILPAGLPKTTVWSYGVDAIPGTFNYPAFTIEAQFNQPLRVKWVNGLADTRGNFLPHLLPVDQTLHWANPVAGPGGIDSRGTDPLPYLGPVPIVTHVHGAHTHQESDGYPEAWYLPAALNIPAGYATEGSAYAGFAASATTGPWGPGFAIFEYPNSQRATTLWYHDHSLGMTRQNVYAGPAGFYLVRGGPDDDVRDNLGNPAILPGPAPTIGSNPLGTYYEIPIVIQDRSFNADGSLFYPSDRAFFQGLTPAQLQIPFIPQLTASGQPSDVSAIWNPEFFGNTMVVNGSTWPFLDVEQRRYRLRFLNGCNSRFLILDFRAIPGVEVWQIGAEGGFLPAPVNLATTPGSNQPSTLLMAPAERADLIVDFTNVAVGNYTLSNLGPDTPFGGGIPGTDFQPSDPATTGQVLQFRVIPAVGADPSTPAANLVLPAISPTPPSANTRQVSLNEEMSKTVLAVTNPDGSITEDPVNGVPFGPTSALLGTVTGGVGTPQLWMNPITENPALGATETWEIYNFTADAHPIHLHLVQFEVLERQVVGGAVRPPEPTEAGRKDTVIAYPGEITRSKATFDRAGLFVWHCHILEHEDNEMMRPYRVGP